MGNIVIIAGIFVQVVILVLNALLPVLVVQVFVINAEIGAMYLWIIFNTSINVPVVHLYMNLKAIGLSIMYASPLQQQKLALAT